MQIKYNNIFKVQLLPTTHSSKQSVFRKLQPEVSCWLDEIFIEIKVTIMQHGVVFLVCGTKEEKCSRSFLNVKRKILRSFYRHAAIAYISFSKERLCNSFDVTCFKFCIINDWEIYFPVEIILNISFMF